MMMLNVFKHVIFPGKASIATLVDASKGLTLFDVSMCCAVTVQVCSKVESLGAVGKVTAITTTMFAVGMITVISLNVCFKNPD
jgi:hypothetical protein